VNENINAKRSMDKAALKTWYLA